MNTFAMVGLAGFLILTLIYLWASFNGFVVARNKVKTDFADIDVQLKRRASLIENLVEIVKGYAKHEKETFEEVAKARASLGRSHGAVEMAAIENLLTKAVGSLFAISEAYPQLKASDNFKQLSDELKQTEDSIATYREAYNQTVLDYNTKIQTFPNLLIAGLFGFQEEELFEPGATSDTSDVSINLG